MYLIFTPLFYINDKPHIGHMYTTYIVKFFSRLLLTCGKTCLPITGTDEHGEKVYKSYLEYMIVNNKQIKFIDYINLRRKEFSEINKIFPYVFEYHSHTAIHHFFIHEIYSILKERKIIYGGEYSGEYSLKKEERYLNEQEVKTLTTKEKEFVEFRKEKGFYLKLSDSIKLKIIQEIKNILLENSLLDYSINIIKQDNDVFITRNSNNKQAEQHSVSVPDEKEQLFYVWFDAILFYISIFRLYNTDIVTPYIVIGKDILKFHISLLQHLSEIYFGKFPFKIIVHGMLYHNKEKLSKSLNNASLIQEEYLKKFGNIFFSALLANGIKNDIELSEDLINNFIVFIKNNVRNFHKRIYNLYHKYSNNLKNILLYQHYIFNSEYYCQLKKCLSDIYDSSKNPNSSYVFEKLKEVSSLGNKIITDYTLWEYHEDKTSFFIICLYYSRVMVILENILCVPGSEKLLEVLGEQLSSSLMAITSNIKLDIEKIDINIFNLEI